MKYVLKLKSYERPTNDQVEEVTAIEGVQIVGRDGYSLFAEIAPETIESVQALLPKWAVTPEVKQAVP